MPNSLFEHVCRQSLGKSPAHLNYVEENEQINLIRDDPHELIEILMLTVMSTIV